MPAAVDNQSTVASAGNSTVLPPVRGGSGANTKKQQQTSSGSAHLKYHHCNCYGHEKSLPNYKLLAIPRTNNYYHATGGCPCIPRAAAHPGSWRLKEATRRSASYRCGSGCVSRQPTMPQTGCCVHTGYQYGWRPGPHPVLSKNTAASGKCDTYGNLAFKSKSRVYLGDDGASEVSSASPQKLEDLEALILEEHAARMQVETDINELADIEKSGTQDLYKEELDTEQRRRRIAAASEDELNELLRDIRGIVDRPLNQTNMELLNRIIARQEMLQRRRDYFANKACEEHEKRKNGILI